MGFLAKLLFGDGALGQPMRDALQAEGLVLIEENLRGSVRYHHFRMPGRRSHGKVTPERIGLGISEQRVVAYGRSGRAKLIDSPFTSRHLDMVDVSAVDDRVEFLVDYDRRGDPRASGRIVIRIHTPNAATIVRELHARLGR
jgi:hypothetical protein